MFQLLLGSERTVSKALRQPLELEVIKLAVRYYDRLWITSDRALAGFKQKKRLLAAYMPVL
jgi:hypothetical protein